eukprot:TRINITY_DN9808_c0_g1_i1.p1 TRINITY_DN9808_c0_g1~~TRINITY_DN9808_c0_g1_i1.p1  ORF type:complete len:183 (+),score=25.88 TRINITY_DN9808_c0_g1_i1:45-593(+)
MECGSSLQAVAAIKRLEEQCGSKEGVEEIISQLISAGRYGGMTGGVERKLDSGKYIYEASRELLLLLGFSQQEESCFSMSENVTTDPAVLAALIERLSYLTPKEIVEESQPLNQPRAVPIVSKRSPLTKRLPSISNTKTAICSEFITNDLISNGSSFVCDKCGGIVPIERHQQHVDLWCSAS